MKYKIIGDISYKKEQVLKDMLSFFYLLFVPRPTLCHHQGDRVADPTLISTFIHVLTRRLPCGSCNEVGSLRPAKRLVRFESETFQFICDTLSRKTPSWYFQDYLIDSSIILRFSSIHI